MDILSSYKYQVASYKFVNRKLKIREIVIARSETTKQSKFTLVGLLHFVRNDTVYPPSLHFPPACGGKVKRYLSFVKLVFNSCNCRGTMHRAQIREIEINNISTFPLCVIHYSLPPFSVDV
jgi:hypothetical protein